MIRRTAAVAAAFVAIALGAVLAAPSASAHAALRSSEPAGGAQIAAAPDEVTITFTEQPEPSLSSIRVVNAAGTSHEQGRPSPIPGDSLTLRTRIGGADEGVYTVLWRVVSKVDGHATAGSFAFGVGVSPAGATPPPVASDQPAVPDRSSLEMLGRLLLFAGVVAVVGGAWFALVVLGGMPRGTRTWGADRERILRRVMGFSAAGWSLGAIGVPLLAEAQRRAAGSGFAELAPTSLGRALIWRAVAVLAAGLALAVAVHGTARVRRVAVGMAGVAAAAAALVHVEAGHASATGSPAVQVGAQWIHVIAMSIWVGGLGSLLAGVRGAPTAETTRAVARYSAGAAFALLAVLATGVARSLGELERLGDLTATGYGRALLVKIAVFAGIAALGAVNRFRNVARSATTLRPLRRVVGAEATLAVVALVAAAILASLAPPTPPAAAAESQDRIVATGSDFATTVRARVTIEPGFAGINDVTVRLADYDSNEPIDDAEVSIRFSYEDDTTVPASITLLEPRGRGRYTAQTPNLSLDGRWRLAILVQHGSGSVEIAVPVTTRCRVTATPAERQPTLYDAALPGGRSAQMYADPAGSKTEVHVTLFDAQGTETFVRSVAVAASLEDAPPVTLPHRRFSDGHFIAAGELAPGRWRFDIGIATPDGTFKTCFEETIGG